MSGADQDAGLPLSFYGLSYLGKPVHVAVQGESPMPGAAGATPTGAMGIAPSMVGPTGVGGAVGATTGGAAGSPDTSAATALQAIGLARQTGSLTEKAITGAALPTARQLQLADEAAPPQPILDVGGTEVLGASPPPSTPSSLSGTDVGGLGLTAANIGLTSAQLAGAKIDPDITKALAAAGLAFGVATANPFAIIGSIPGLGLFGGFDPVRETLFPQPTFEQFSSTIKNQLPAPVEIPASATAEQRQQIQAANDVIQQVQTWLTPLGGFQKVKDTILSAGRPFSAGEVFDLFKQEGIPGGAIGWSNTLFPGIGTPSLTLGADRWAQILDHLAATTDFPNVPSFLLGNKTPEDWQNVLNQVGTQAQDYFTQLQTLYPAAVQASRASTAPPATSLSFPAPTTAAATPAPATPPAMPPQQVMPAGFFSGEHKLPEAA